MTGIERITNALNHKKSDRVGVHETFWQNTPKNWKEQGYIPEDTSLEDHFGYDMRGEWAFNLMADIDFEPIILSETEDTILSRDGNGAVLKTLKDGTGTPEHVDYLVKCREDWEEHIKPKLVADPRRIRLSEYKWTKNHAREKNAFFCASGVNVFEAIHPMCGHENLLMGMALDPEWVLDMVDTYSTFIINLQEMLFSLGGKPDGMWYCEDMGYKEKPFMSPNMYKELIFPGHKKIIDFNKSQGLPVIMHSCGFVEPLLPGMIEAGISCLQNMEIKAGMDLVRIYKNYGDKIALMGGMDVRAIIDFDKEWIDRELDKLNYVKQGNGYILHSDHSIPPDAPYEAYKYFLEKGLELGKNS